MTKQCSPFSVRVFMAIAILMLMAASDSLAQPATGPLTGNGGQGQVLSRPTDLVTRGAVYSIKSKGSQKVLDVSACT